MNDTTGLVSLISALGPNLVYNLDSIPADKFDWKPAPSAKSVKEIIEHLLGNFDLVNSQFAPVEPHQSAINIQAAKEALQTAIQTFAQNLRDASPEKLASNVELPQLAIQLGVLAKIAVSDTIHHHGQIAYIQTLLGDDESHFLPDFFEKLS